MSQGSQDALVLQPRLDAAALARRHARQLLVGWGLDELVDPVLLLTSEVVTNALLHSGTTLSVSVRRDGPGVRVSVEDGSSVPPVQRRHSTSASTGRGVQLLSSIADEWSWEATPTGKVVWFSVLSDRGWTPAVDLDGLAGIDL